MLKGDTGRFISGVFTQLQDSLGTLLTAQQLLGGVAPERLQKIQTDAAEAPKLLGLLSQHGVVVGIEIAGLEPPSAQLTLIVPDAAAKAGPLFGTIRLIMALAGTEAKEMKLAGRTVNHLDLGPVQAGWWVEGKHAVVTVGTNTLDTV